MISVITGIKNYCVDSVVKKINEVFTNMYLNIFVN